MWGLDLRMSRLEQSCVRVRALFSNFPASKTCYVGSKYLRVRTGIVLVESVLKTIYDL